MNTDKKLRIKCFGWRCPPLGQIERIEQGFKELGFEVNTTDGTDFIYCYDSSKYNDALVYKRVIEPEAKLLLQVLDIPTHIPNFDYDNLKQKLVLADKILAISQFVQTQIKETFGLESSIVYDTIQETYHITGVKKEVDFIMGGRLCDPNKRFDLMLELLKMSDNRNRFFAIFGSECPSVIKVGYLGILSQHNLNNLYNVSRFCFCFGKLEGLNLMPHEAAIAGCIPLVCSDSTTVNEFIPKEFQVFPDPVEINKRIKEIENNYDEYQKLAFQMGEKSKEKFSARAVCNRIISVYKSLI